MKKPPIILVFVRYYLPGYKAGGPLRTIANMVEQLGDEFDFRIITSDRDALDHQPYSGVMTDHWVTVGKAQVFYTSPGTRTLKKFARLIRDTPYDVMYLNSFFDPQFTGLPLLDRWLKCTSTRAVIVASRGEFSPGALEIRAWKKKPYIFLSQLLGLYRNTVWHASNDHEAADIRRIMKKFAQNIVIAPNLPTPISTDGTDSRDSSGDDGKSLRVVFLSRVSPKKNLDFVLRVLKKVTVSVTLDIYGLIDDAWYWSLCEKELSLLPSSINVSYNGAIPHESVVATLAKYDLFFLPTRGENYGHVILEALTAGVPVLISDQTPWCDLDHMGVGFVRSLANEDDFVKVIENLANLDKENRNEQRQKAKDYARRYTNNNNLQALNRELFQNLIASN